MSTYLSMDQLAEARGRPVFDSNGDKIGEVDEIFYDEQTGRPEWIGIGTGFFGTKRVLVPVEGASLREDGYYVPYAKSEVKNSPDIDSDEISQDLERELYSYYGLGYSEQRSDTGLPEGPPGTTGTATSTYARGDVGLADREEGEIVRAEEELRVGKRETEAGRVRLRKWVETEPASADVELRRETARVEREPINQPVSGVELGEQEVDVTLRAEEAVVGKEVVAKERITVDKETEIEQERITDEVRRERVEIEGDNVVDDDLRR